MQAGITILLAVLALSSTDIEQAEWLGGGSLVVAAGAITISCAGRPAAKFAFVLYGFVELGALIMVIMTLLVPIFGQDCGSDSDACPSLITASATIADAQAACAT